MLHMEQKDYINEIINFLLEKRNGHVRGIAKALHTNHMIIQRRIKELSKMNIVDFTQEGKNKVYSLKNTIEAKNHAYMAENYKLLRILAKHPELRRIIEKIQIDNRIKLALLFGSYVKGTIKKGSDIDIFIETSDKNIKKELSMLDSRLSIKIGQYIKESPLIKEIKKNHVIIKGIEKYYEKDDFFKEIT